MSPGLAQLPPTNMGKYVHQPGDNQYSQQTQMERHGVQQAPQVQYASAPAPLSPTPVQHRPDISLDPIAADEPVPPAGFPPMPDRLDLPIASSGSWTRSPSGGGDTAGGGPSPGLTPAGPPQPTFHQHYGHVPPGAFLPPQSQAAPAAQQSGGSGYYKARSPGDYFNSNTGGAGGPPAYTGASAKDLRSLGREPKLNDRLEQPGAPDAPQPVVVNQAQTQDLSLPEDEFAYQAHGKGARARIRNNILYRVIRMPLNSVGGVAGIRF